jgi:RND family efflux transporter MFP subunit
MAMSHGLIRGGLFFAGLLTALSGCREDEETTREIPPRPIKSFVVSEAAGTMARRFAGILEPSESAALSFAVPGSVVEIPIGVGMSVAQGDVIARLDPEPFELEIAAARAELERLMADLEAKQADLARNTELFEKEWVSRAAIEKQQAAVDAADSAAGYARSRLALAERNLAHSILLAPYDGRIASRAVDAFEEVGAGQPIVELNSDAGLLAAFAVPEVGVGLIAPGQAVELTFAALPGEIIEGRITEIEAAATSGNAFTVKASLLQQSGQLRPGMTASVITRADAGAGTTGYFVPLSAIAPGEGDFGGSVFRFDREAGVVRQVPIRAEGVRDDFVIVAEGIAPGDIVASAGVSFLIDGQAVRLLGEEE